MEGGQVPFYEHSSYKQAGTVRLEQHYLASIAEERVDLGEGPQGRPVS